MTTRGVHKPDTDLVTSRMLGCFRDNTLTRQEFLGMATWRNAAEEEMADQQAPPAGPDLSEGIPSVRIRGREACSATSATRKCCWCVPGSEIFAIGAHCSHYHGPLAEGLVAGEGIRCPWHHACFDLRTGEATRRRRSVRSRAGRSSSATAGSSSGKSVNSQSRRPQGRTADAPEQDRDRRRWRGGLCRCRDAAARRIIAAAS